MPMDDSFLRRVLRLRERWGQFGFALALSLIWALPMAAWAGSVDLEPGPGPWIALWIGMMLLVVWLVLVLWMARIPVSPRHRRYDVGAMSTSERRWSESVSTERRSPPETSVHSASTRSYSAEKTNTRVSP